MWFNWDLYVVPDVYSDMHAELRATRDGVSMGDMSPLSKYAIRGGDATRFLDEIVTRDVSSLEIGQVVYTPWTDERGKMVGDGLVFRMDATEYRLTTDPQLEWLSRHADGLDVEVEDLTDGFGLLALQGPRSIDVMDALTGGSWADMPFSRARTTSVAGTDILVARQGFTGELGFEMWVPAQVGRDVWDAVATAGERFVIVPTGEHAIDVARVEAGLLIVGADYTGAGPDRPGSVIDLSSRFEASPAEIGLGGFVDLEKGGDFIGRSALISEAEAGGPRLHLTGLELDHAAVSSLYEEQGRPPLFPDRVWWYPLEVAQDGNEVGHASSVTWAPSVGRLIGFGHLIGSVAVPGTAVSVRWTLNDVSGEVPAHVLDLPFLQLRRSG